MAKINKTDIYPIKENINFQDYLIGTDGESNNKETVSFKIFTLLDYLSKNLTALNLIFETLEDAKYYLITNQLDFGTLIFVKESNSFMYVDSSEIDFKYLLEDAGKVNSVNGVLPDVSKNVTLKISNLEDDKGLALLTDLNNEINNRINDYNELQLSIGTETSNRITQINNIEQKLQTEKSERISEDDILNYKIETTKTELNTNFDAKLSQESTLRQNQDAVLDNKITTEKSERISEDDILNYKIETTKTELNTNFDAKLSQESTLRQNQDAVLDNKITTEKTDRINADNLKLDKPLENATDQYVILGDGTTSPKSDFGKVDKVMGVAPDANKNVDFSGVALNWTHANQRFSGLADRSSDATFNGIMGLDNSGNAAKITQSARLLEATLQGTTSEQALRIGNLLNGGNGSSGAISVNLISPSLIQNTRNHIEYVLLRGANLLLNNTDMSISICDEGKSVIQRIPNEQIINNSTTELLFYYNFYQFTTGTYYLKITSGVKIYFTILDLQIVNEVENIDINAITWDINYKEGVIPKNTDYTSGGHVSITTLMPLTELPIQSLKSSPLFSKDDDFYIEFTLELGAKYLHKGRYSYFSFIGLGDSSIPNTLYNNSFIYLKYSHSWDFENAMYNNDSQIRNLVTPAKTTVNIIKTKGICRMVIGSSNVNVIVPNMDYFSLFMAFTGNEYELLTQIKIIKAFKIK